VTAAAAAAARRRRKRRKRRKRKKRLMSKSTSHRVQFVKTVFYGHELQRHFEWVILFPSDLGFDPMKRR